MCHRAFITFCSQPKGRGSVLFSRCVGKNLAVRCSAAPTPTVADAKQAFLQAFPKPLPAIYSTVVLELLVQQHLYRWNKNYKYSEVTSLGICSVFDQVLEGLPPAERDAVFEAYVAALQEDAAQYRKDAAELEEWARSLSSPEEVTPKSDGSTGQQALARVAQAVGDGKFLYTKFFAVGLFRILELTGARDPKALGSVVTALGIPQERVNADLLTYKGVLSKLQAAKEIMKEFIEREKKKNAEREAAKAQSASAAAQASSGGDDGGNPTQAVEA